MMISTHIRPGRSSITREAIRAVVAAIQAEVVIQAEAAISKKYQNTRRIKL